LSYCPGMLEPDDAFVWPLAAACAVHKYLAESTSLEGFRIKWPNDIYHGDQKIAGILTKGVSGPDGFYIIVGIGLNIYNTVPLNGTVNLKELVPDWNRDIRDTAESILSHIGERPERQKTADYVNRYLWGKNETKTVSSGGVEFEALLRCVSCDLSLVMEKPPGGDTVMMNIGEVL